MTMYDDKAARFLAAVDLLQKEHGISISHEDGHGAFELLEGYGHSWIDAAGLYCPGCRQLLSSPEGYQAFTATCTCDVATARVALPLSPARVEYLRALRAKARRGGGS